MLCWLEIRVSQYQCCCAGHHTGRARVTAAGLVRLEFEWPDPVGGRGHDEFRLVAENELHVDSRIQVEETVVAYTTVYRRR